MIKLPKKISKISKSLPHFKFGLKLNKKIKRIIILVAGILAAGFLLFFFRSIFVVAVVNNRPVSRFTFDRELERQAGKQILENMVTQKLIFQEAKKLKVIVEQKEIDEKVKEIETQYGFKESELDSFLTMQGQTRKDFDESIKLQVIVEKILGKDIVISDEEAKKYFDDNKTSFDAKSTFEKEKEGIVKQLKQEKLSEKITTWLTDLKGKAKILYFWKP